MPETKPTATGGGEETVQSKIGQKPIMNSSWLNLVRSPIGTFSAN
jgi:hypothetical protein